MNVPDDWDMYYTSCSRCGKRYHMSEGGCDCAELAMEAIAETACALLGKATCLEHVQAALLEAQREAMDSGVDFTEAIDLTDLPSFGGSSLEEDALSWDSSRVLNADLEIVSRDDFTS